jgi:hypothetical protein
MSLENDKMDCYTLARLNETYFASSSPLQYGQTPPKEYVISWPSDINAASFRRDTELFQETLAVPSSSYDSLASRIFGNQLRRQKLSVKHQANLLYERAFLYSRHVAEIKSRHMRVQEDLFKEKLMSPVQTSRRQVALETMLLDLEKDKRKEELDFWADSKDIRESLFEDAGEYQASSHRVQMLQAFGGTYARV